MRAQVDPHLDRFMVDLQQRVAAADAASGRQRGAGTLTETLAAAQQQQPTTLSFTCRPIGPHAVSESAASLPGSSPEASGQQPGTEVHAVLLETSAAASPPIACPKGAPPQKQAVLVEASKLPDLAGGDPICPCMSPARPVLGWPAHACLQQTTMNCKCPVCIMTTGMHVCLLLPKYSLSHYSGRRPAGERTGGGQRAR